MLVDSNSYEDQRSISAQVTWGEPSAINAPSWSGIVTWVRDLGNPQVSSGESLLEIDGIQRVLYSSAFPFYRQLQSGSSGSDVAQLNQMLTDFGYSAGEGGTWSTYTEAGLSTFASNIGVQGEEARKVFDPSWVIWMQSSPFSVASINANVGGQAPAPGEPIAASVKPIVNVALDETPGFLTSDMPGARTLEVNGQSFDFVSGDGGPVADRASLANAIGDGTESVSFLAKFASETPGMTIPIGAVLPETNGEYFVCAKEVDGANEPTGAWEKSRVQFVASGIGSVFITGFPSESAAILTNPSSLLEPERCL